MKAANKAFYEMFNIKSKDIINKIIYEEWDIPGFRESLERIIPLNSDVENLEVDREFPGTGRKKLRVNAKRIYRDGKGTKMILLAIEDNTVQKT